MDHILICLLSTCRHFPFDSYVIIWSKYGLLSCSFSDSLTLVEHMQNISSQIFLIGCSRHPLESWAVVPQSVLCWQCVHIILGANIHSVLKFIIIQSLKIMFLCGFHWHSRYSIWISTFVLLHCVWFSGSSCNH